MKLIKFRQPRLNIKGKFIDWFYWGFIDTGFISPIKHDVENYQFTGLLDKNGKEIFEGDIIEDAYEGINAKKYEVSFSDGAYVVNGDDLFLGWIEQDKYLMVIGNIYENKELLEKAK